MKTFIEVSRLQEYHTTAAERAAIMAEVVEEHPGEMHEFVEGGVMVFDTIDEYHTWAEQS